MVPLAAAFLLLALPARAGTCPQRYTSAAMAWDLGTVQSSLKSGDSATLRIAGGRLELNLACLGEPVSVPALAAAFRAIGVVHGLEGDAPGAMLAFRTAQDLDPVFAWGVQDFDAASPIPALWQQVSDEPAARFAPMEGRALSLPTGTRLLLDGRPLDRPAARPDRLHLVQLVGDDGSVQNAWVIQGNAFPDALFESTPTAVEATGIADLPASDPDLRTKGSLWCAASVDTAHEEGTDEDVAETLSRFELQARWNTPPGGRMVLEVAGEHSMQWSDEGRVRWAAWPEEVYLDQPLGTWGYLRVGQMDNRWGKLEATPVVDVLVPRDMRYGPLLKVDEARIPLPMARLELNPGRLRIQATYLPFHVPARFDLVGSDQAFFPTGFWEDMATSFTDWTGDPQTAALAQALVMATESRLQDATPDTWWAMNAAFQQTGDGWQPLWGMEGALRLSWEGSRSDGSFMVANVREDFPVIALNPQIAAWMRDQSWPPMAEFQAFLVSGEPLVALRYPRTWMVGADWSALVGSFNLRSEGAFFTNRGLEAADLTGTASPEVALGLGFEYTGSTVVQYGGEASVRWLSDVQKDLLAREETEALVSAFLRLQLFRERVRPGISFVLDPRRTEALVQANLEWRINDRFTASGGAALYAAPTGTPRTFDELQTYDGGALGLYSDNDAYVGRVTWWF